MTIVCTRTAAWRRLAASAIGTAAALALAFAALVGAAPPAMAQFTQQGAKLVGTGYVYGTNGVSQGYSVALSADSNTAIVGGWEDNSAIGAAWVFTRSGHVWTQQAELLASDESGTGDFGTSVALSADGNTAIVGGSTDNGFTGAAWIFTRSGATWSQQGSKLVGNDSSGDPQQGGAVALSADGNTALVGGFGDSSLTGAAWVYTRSGGTWSQQGSKLVGNDSVSAPDGVEQGSSVALSADGNTALVGGTNDDSDAGAAWVYTRSGGTWSQQGSKLAASDASGGAELGVSAALSADGNTALLGGYDDNSKVGAAWVFTRSGGAWSQQGPKLTAGDESGDAGFGTSAALSGDGNTALVGGYADNGDTGAAWVFGRTGGTWSQQGSKLVGNDSSGSALQGSAAALSADGNTAMFGGDGDNGAIGAAWVFTRTVPTNTHDFNVDGVSDILWVDGSGDAAMWLMSAGQFSSGAELGNVGTSWMIVGASDYNGDGNADILWLDTSGNLGLWLMDGTSASSYASLGNVGIQWSISGSGDFNGDGTSDILWRNTFTGDAAIWLMSSGRFSSGVDFGDVSLTWAVAGTGDFNGDGTTDILWRNGSNGELAIWFMSNGQFSSGLNIGRVSTDWTVVGTGDFNGDGVSDIVWRDSEGDLAIWLMNSSGQMASGTTFAGIPTTWFVAEIGDYDGDGKSDILWIDRSGNLGVWLMDGLSVSSAIGLGNVGTNWDTWELGAP